MKKFNFRSVYFELDLEGFDDPIGAFREVVDALDKSGISAPAAPSKTTVAANDESTEFTDSSLDHVDIDEFFADSKPTKIRALLEGTARYLTRHQGKQEFTTDELFETAKKSPHYDATWAKNRASTLKTMIKAGFIIKRPEGRLRLRAD